MAEARNRREDGRMDLDDGDDNLLIFQRVLGHKEIPYSGQWRMLTKISDKCWVCHHHIHTIIFWSTRVGFIHQKRLDSMQDEILIQKGQDLQREAIRRKEIVQQHIDEAHTFIKQMDEELLEIARLKEALRDAASVA